jgi:hypothetical protein
MKQNFADLEEYSDYIKTSKVQIATVMYKGIEKAMKVNAKEASVFEIFFEGEEFVYEVTIEQNEWINTLKSCLEIFTEKDSPDNAIEVYQLLEIAKELIQED